MASAYIIASAMITAGLLLIVWLYRGLGDGLAAYAYYAYAGLIVWGLATLVALWSNRRQGLWHSASGISHHEIDSRQKIAMHAIDTHASLLLKRWEIDEK